MNNAWVGDVESISLLPDESSNIESASFDHMGNLLTITFRAGGVYRYFEVPVQTWSGLKSAESKGKYFHSRIRGIYRTEKVPL